LSAGISEHIWHLRLLLHSPHAISTGSSRLSLLSGCSSRAASPSSSSSSSTSSGSESLLGILACPSLHSCAPGPSESWSVVSVSPSLAVSSSFKSESVHCGSASGGASSMAIASCICWLASASDRSTLLRSSLLLFSASLPPSSSSTSGRARCGAAFGGESSLSIASCICRPARFIVRSTLTFSLFCLSATPCSARLSWVSLSRICVLFVT
jgi:hypothetical protein